MASRAGFAAGLCGITVAALPGCTVNNPPPGACSDGEFNIALSNAEAPNQNPQNAIVHTLVPITPGNPQLTWNSTGDEVLMTLWTNYLGYQVGPNTLTRNIFVAPAPQVKELCKTVPPADRPARLDQYLGLPPEGAAANDRRVVEMFVKPADMFRPCPDPEIDDDSCDLTFPPNVDPAHKAWFESWYATSFGFWQPSHFPFTGHGYTYDWCNNVTHVGASEYVVRTGSTIDVQAYNTTDDYCQ